mmetsp:Transcript_34986/g.82004  ORF Transcript_34986/g.82004 Transcript_34986/m.82004 type:complete len:114 (+) Transcript_34986:23-364(+)|eukprot:CAMPEP_0169463716 /NCGR_PEP_ID=MMETSP1042-20121227/20262_1 /TAXON_ID=464988 /ORGANISM="Hemiselmis andersenii, Strain CCMP1180" /LENGTH=113 /DNA_ID=CAMNT_0009576479 /DNA_START=206 /DNA_END=547 /DNA_ORIENTATION=+
MDSEGAGFEDSPGSPGAWVEAVLMPGAVDEEPSVEEGRREAPAIASQFMSMGREAQAFGLGWGSKNADGKAASAAVPGPGPASLASNGAPAGSLGSAGEGQRMSIHGEFFHAN